MNGPITRKRRTREHIIADLSVNHVERQVLLCGYTVERPHHDYGYDLLMTTYDGNGEVESGEVRLQLKATDALPTLRGGAIPWRIARSDLARWLNDPFPVILVVYDAHRDVAFWLYVQRHFQGLPSFSIFSAARTLTVHIADDDRLGPAAIRQFAQFRNAITQQYRGRVDHDA